MAKAFFIDAAAHTISEVVITSLKDMQAHVGGYIQIAYEWANGDVLYVDEEGLLKSQEHWFRLHARSDQPLAGNGLIVGSDEDGDNADVVTPLAEIDVTFHNRAQAEAWAKGNASDPAIVITSIGPNGEIQDETVVARYGAVMSQMPKE